jgi:GDPmannose 4,6-dehydratase
MKALVTGISGQDGYFLTQLLKSRKYEIHGIIRRNSSMGTGTMALLPDEVRDEVEIHYGDINDAHFVTSIIAREKPDELYHLAAQSFVGYSFQNPFSTYDSNIGGTLNICNAVKDVSSDTRFYFAATSELFGHPAQTPQNENTPFLPRNPYAISKLAGIWTTRTYRDAYKLFISNGILFNHESEVRGPEFVSRKISIGVAKIYRGSNNPILLGNLNAVKDWGYSKDYVYGMWQMLQQDTPDDFVLGTGESHTVRDFVEAAFKEIDIGLEWKGSGLNEVGICNGRTLVKVSKEFLRPLESENYRADYSKAKKKLKWEPKTNFQQLVKIMVRNDIARLGKAGLE